MAGRKAVYVNTYKTWFISCRVCFREETYPAKKGERMSSLSTQLYASARLLRAMFNFVLGLEKRSNPAKKGRENV
jgi:hypothetical protein